MDVYLINSGHRVKSGSDPGFYLCQWVIWVSGSSGSVGQLGQWVIWVSDADPVSTFRHCCIIILLWSLPLGNINTSFVIINHPKYCRFVAMKFVWQEYQTFLPTPSKGKSYSYARQTKMLVNTIKNVENHFLFGDQW